jgi:gluconolactonase
MTVDCAGNVYVTSGGVTVYDPGGNELGRITVSSPSNLAFGGADRKTLFITAGSSLYGIDMNVPGMPY